MAGTIEKLQTINSFIRTLLALVLMGGAGTAGWYGYTTYNAAEIENERKDAALQEKEQELAASRQQIERHKQELVAKDEELAGKEAKISEQRTEIDESERGSRPQTSGNPAAGYGSAAAQDGTSAGEDSRAGRGRQSGQRPEILEDRIRGTERIGRSGRRAQTVPAGRRNGLRRLLGRQIRGQVRRTGGPGAGHVDLHVQSRVRRVAESQGRFHAGRTRPTPRELRCAAA